MKASRESIVAHINKVLGGEEPSTYLISMLEKRDRLTWKTLLKAISRASTVTQVSQRLVNILLTLPRGLEFFEKYVTHRSWHGSGKSWYAGHGLTPPPSSFSRQGPRLTNASLRASVHILKECAETGMDIADALVEDRASSGGYRQLNELQSYVEGLLAYNLAIQMRRDMASLFVPQDKSGIIAVLGAFDTWPYMDAVAKAVALRGHSAVTSRFVYRKFNGDVIRAYTTDCKLFEGKPQDMTSLLQRIVRFCPQAVIVYSVAAAHYIETDWCARLGKKVLGIAMVRDVHSPATFNCGYLSVVRDKGEAIYSFCEAYRPDGVWSCLKSTLFCPFIRQDISKNVIEYFLTRQKGAWRLCALENISHLPRLLNDELPKVSVGQTLVDAVTAQKYEPWFKNWYPVYIEDGLFEYLVEWVASVSLDYISSRMRSRRACERVKRTLSQDIMKLLYLGRTGAKLQELDKMAGIEDHNCLISELKSELHEEY